jgi:CRP/FNR family transcriptional regulator, transcriptional activator FtrB
MREIDSQQVRTLPLFRDMEQRNFESLVTAAFLQRFPSRVVLIQEGDTPDFLHVIVDGAVDLFARQLQHETTLTVLGSGATFILAAVMCEEPFLKSARTLVSSRILMIPADSVRRMFGIDNGFARASMSELAIRYRAIVKDLKGQKLRSGIERLGSWVLQQSLARAGAVSFDIAIDKRTLASLLGMTPENLSRNISDLCEHGVRVKGRSVAIENPAALRRLVHPSATME